MCGGHHFSQANIASAAKRGIKLGSTVWSLFSEQDTQHGEQGKVIAFRANEKHPIQVQFQNMKWWVEPHQIQSESEKEQNDATTKSIKEAAAERGIQVGSDVWAAFTNKEIAWGEAGKVLGFRAHAKFPMSVQFQKKWWWCQLSDVLSEREKKEIDKVVAAAKERGISRGSIVWCVLWCQSLFLVVLPALNSVFDTCRRPRASFRVPTPANSF